MKKIIVEHLKYKYPLADKLALNDISFEVEEGDFIGIVGKNSSGKSTLCQALVGLVPHFYRGAYGGKVIVDGLEVKTHDVSEISQKAGIVFQNPFTQVTGSKISVYEEISFGLENIGLSRLEMIERIDAALHLLGIYEFKDRRPFDLSGGQMQRMAIACIIAMQPDVIILDEPTSQLDPQGSKEVFQAVESLRKEGKTVIMVEHKIEKIAEYCNKVAVLKEGELVAFDIPSIIFSRNDIDDLEILPPIYTKVCKRLGVKKSLTEDYPITLSEAASALSGGSFYDLR